MSNFTPLLGFCSSSSSAFRNCVSSLTSGTFPYIKNEKNPPLQSIQCTYHLNAHILFLLPLLQFVRSFEASTAWPWKRKKTFHLIFRFLPNQRVHIQGQQSAFPPKKPFFLHFLRIFSGSRFPRFAHQILNSLSSEKRRKKWSQPLSLSRSAMWAFKLRRKVQLFPNKK